MGGNNSKQKNATKINYDSNRDADLRLIQDQIKSLFKFKILLLGAGESGKSTVVKQIKLLHHKAIPQEELDLTAASMHQNIIDCFQSLLKAHRLFGIELKDEEDRQTGEILMNWETQTRSQETGARRESVESKEQLLQKRISPDLAVKMIKLFKTETMQQVYERRNEFWLLDSFNYYIDNLVRFASANWVPSEEDTVMARIRTTGIVVTEIDHKINQPEKDLPDIVHFQVVDVGGQRNERKKWIHCFDDVKAILFVENLAGYNQVMFEDERKNRMHESLELFSKVTSNSIFNDTPIFLFLNKKDLFEEMIQQTDLNKTFPEYTGGKDAAKALEFITDQFKKHANSKKFVIHTLTARWKGDVNSAFEDVQKYLIDQNKDRMDEEIKKIRAKQQSITGETQKTEKGQSKSTK